MIQWIWDTNFSDTAISFEHSISSSKLLNDFSGRFPNLNDGEMGPISGWWLTYPSEKYESQLDAYSQYMET